ncbi:MAG: ATP-binding protein [Gemmobacter sp.]
MSADRVRGAGDPADRVHLVIPAEAEAVRHALVAACDTRLLRSLTDDARGTAQIVIAEALNNIVEHAYASGEGDIELSLRRKGGKLSVLISDRGRPMPGGQMPEGRLPDPDPQDLPEGGFGWFLIRSLSQDLRYCRSEGRNHLFFRLDTDPPAQQSTP